MTIIKWRTSPYISRMLDNFTETDNSTNLGKNCGCMPATNIFEREGSFEIQIAFPGVEKKDLDISIENNLLKVSYEAKEYDSDSENYIRQEFYPESFTRSFVIPKETNIDKIKAAYEKGILIVSVPKADAEKAKIQKSISIS